MVSDRDSDDLQLLPTFVDGKPNPEAAKLDAQVTHAVSYRGAAAAVGRRRCRRPGGRR